MAFELNLKFTERLYLSGVSITSKNWKKDSCRYFVFIKRRRFQVEYLYVRAPFMLKLPWYLTVYAERRRTQQIMASGVVAMNFVRMPKL